MISWTDLITDAYCWGFEDTAFRACRTDWSDLFAHLPARKDRILKTLRPRAAPTRTCPCTVHVCLEVLHG